MKKKFLVSYQDIISLDNLLSAWREFVAGKKLKPDVQIFSRDLMDNILQLHNELANHTYRHGGYKSFYITDPKLRHIHKATVRDRVLHHAIYRLLYPFFDKLFIPDSFSCRLNKGTHKAIARFQSFAYKVSKNHTRTCWVLKGDIKKFFASIDHQILINILESYIPDKDIIWLLKNVIESFSIGETNTGLPLGNLTSQLFCNIYLNEFDQHIKCKLRAKYYIRYADDFVLLSENKVWLENQIPAIAKFLADSLKLSLHPDKVYLKTFACGVGFLGWVHFPQYRTIRTTTKKRMMRRIQKRPVNAVLQSYLGLLKYGDSYNLKQDVLNLYGLLEKGF